jgi:plasmid stabilization system protein ParE
VRIRVIEEAEAELDHAVAHYNALFAGLGAEFAANVRDSLSHIEKFPDAWQLLGQRVRRYRLSRFPYGIVYARLETEIVVVAVMHLHRKPEYWSERLARL